jgi:methyl-branched lipid omega-hydroxylase
VTPPHPGPAAGGASQPAPDLSDINLSADEFWARPPAARQAAFARLRALPGPAWFPEPAFPLAYTAGGGYYAFVRHADVTEASRHPELFSSARGATSIVDLPAEYNEYFGSMISMDDPRHARLRRIVSRAFTPRMIARFEADVQRTAAQIVDELLAAGPGDFVAQVAARLPLKIISAMMGIGPEHDEMVLHNTNVILGGGDPEFLSGDLDEAITQILVAGQSLATLVTELAAARQEQPADDLTTALASANVDGEQLTPAELASFFILLVVAGNETTRTAISNALVLLTEYPEQRAALLADLDGRMGGAVDEILRYVSPVIWMRRSATRDCTLNGRDYREGDKALLFYWAANRDEYVFADPDRFDISRSPNPHVAFGGAGPHFCLGAHLAKREITAMLSELLARVPDIRAGEPDRLLSSFINGIKHLPCDFG